jgi:RNA polymerase sigma-70 factor (ECF subfamily)
MGFTYTAPTEILAAARHSLLTPLAMPADYARQVEALRPQLLRYARNQLRNDTWAEDAVSETMLAAFEKPQAFGGQSQLKTWLVGILKHKLIDQIRRHSRECSTTREDEEDIDDVLFAADGHWQNAPQDWGDPTAALKQRQFFEVLEACMELLPAQQGRVFMMREWLELEADEICKETGVSATNMWVLLHRARLRLRACLETRWFTPPAAASR